MSEKRTEIEPDSDFYRTLLESTNAIPWRIDWETLTFSYIGPQIETLLGWPADSWKGIDDWASRIHEEDRERVVNFCVAQSRSGSDHEADYRALTRAGDYVWIRDVVHVVRTGDGVDSLVGFMFDISERKKNEEELLRLHRELEELSFKDGLTGVANRRMFNSSVESEWGNSRRTRQPLSVLLLDIDYFKEYNDLYGHIQGDECLKAVGKALSSVATRPRDVVARFGGEEFVLVLPETDEAAAVKMAERCRQAIMALQIPHERSAVSDVLTVSIGVGTAIPADTDELNHFVNQVDRRLYQAKQHGRNGIDCGEGGCAD